ncbi:MAG TPA: glycosyltransferase family 9 protein [Gemmatimonadaceae bacterium]
MSVHHSLNGGATPRRILLIQIRRLGDVVLTSALLHDLHRAFPHAEIDFLVGHAAEPLLREHPLIHRRIVLDRRRPVRMWRLVRAHRYDWIIDVQSNPRTAMLSLMSRARVRAGWDVRGWGWVYTHRLSRERPPEYVVRERQRLLELLGIPVGEPRPRLYLAEAERARGEADCQALGLAPDRPRVGLVLGSQDQARTWRATGFAEVAESLAAEGYAPILFHMPGDDARVEQFLERSQSAVVANVPDLRHFLGMLSTCRLLISANTGPAHMADAIDIPRVTVFGSTSHIAWSPVWPTVAVVRDESVPVLTLAHATRLAAAGHDLTAGITPDMVLAAARKLLQACDPV